MTKTSQYEETKEPSSTVAANKPKISYSVNVLPPQEEKTKDTSIENNPLKRKSASELISMQLKRGKPETELNSDKIKNFSRGDTIELGEGMGRSWEMDLEEDSKSNVSYRSNSNSNSNADKAQLPIYNRGKKPEELKKQEEFKGEYLEFRDGKGNVRNYVIQVLDKYIKIETGGTDTRNTEVSYMQYFDNQDAINDAQRAIADKLSEGYRKIPAKFIFSFDISEALHGGDPSGGKKNGRGNKSARNSPRPSRNNSPVRRDDDDDNSNWLGIDKDDYSQGSRRTSLVGSEFADVDDLDLSAFIDEEVPIKKKDPEPSQRKTLIAEPNKDHSLGKPITQPYSSLLLAQKHDDKIDPTGYYMSEKLDGVRCLWTGSQMYSRNANRYYPPAFFTKDFPGSPLDGELWVGRSTFQKCVSIVRKKTPLEHEWRLVQYLVFDAPGLNLPFNKRYEKLEEWFSKIDSPYIKLHKHEICKGPEHLMREHERVEKLGGEGMMLRDPKSYYENRRSKTLLKVKNFDDDEATVLAHEEGTSRLQGMMGAIRVRNSQGVVFSIGSGFSDAQRRNPPKIGSKITYKYQGVSTSNTPRFPIFLREFGGH